MKEVIGLDINWEAVGKRIRAYREQANLPQEKVSEMIALSPKFYSMIENGKRGMSIQTLVKLKKILEFDLNYVLLGEITECKENPIVKRINQFDQQDNQYAEKMIDLLFDMSKRNRDDP